MLRTHFSKVWISQKMISFSLNCQPTLSINPTWNVILDGIITVNTNNQIFTSKGKTLLIFQCWLYILMRNNRHICWVTHLLDILPTGNGNIYPSPTHASPPGACTCGVPRLQMPTCLASCPCLHRRVVSRSRCVLTSWSCGLDNCGWLGWLQLGKDLFELWQSVCHSAKEMSCWPFLTGSCCGNYVPSITLEIAILEINPASTLDVLGISKVPWHHVDPQYLLKKVLVSVSLMLFDAVWFSDRCFSLCLCELLLWYNSEMYDQFSQS